MSRNLTMAKTAKRKLARKSKKHLSSTVKMLTERITRVENDLMQSTWRMDELENAHKTMLAEMGKMDSVMVKTRERCDALKASLDLHDGRVFRAGVMRAKIAVNELKARLDDMLDGKGV